MSEQIGANGNEITITIPSSGERDWATSIRDNCFATISSHTHQGTGAGAKLVGYLAFDQTEALITNNVTLKARNNAANGTIDIAKVDTNDEVVLSTIVVSAEFEDAGLTVVDDGDNTKKIALDASAITTATTRVLTMADEAVDLAALKNSNISATAAIALSKLAALTASEMVISDGSGVIVSAPVATYPSLTELAYVKGLTSAVQTQIDTKTDTGTANEITLTGTVIGLADNPVVPGTDSMVVPAGTTAQRVSTTDGSFRFNSDLSSFEGYKSGAWSSIGGGGGGLDVYHEEDFSVNGSADFTTGNDATPDAVGTGTLDGTLSDDASTQIAGTESLKYTMSTSSTNDFFINDADISLDTKQVSNFTGVDFYYKYDGDDDDIRFIVLDQDDAELTATNEYLKSATTATRFSTNIYIPAGSTGVRYGFQVVTGNDTKILLVDDIQLTTNPGVYKNLTETQNYRINQGGSSLTDRDFEMEFNLGTATITDEGDSLLTATDDSSNTRTKFIANKNCYVNVYISGKPNTSTRGMIIGKNGTETIFGGVVAANDLSTASGSLYLAEGDYITFGTGTVEGVPPAWASGIQNDTGHVTAHFQATATAEHVITPAKSNMTDWVDVGVTVIDATTTAPTKPTTTVNDRMMVRRVGDSMEVRVEFKWNSNSGAAIGSGDYLFTIPTSFGEYSGLTIDTTKVDAYSTVEGAGPYTSTNIVGQSFYNYQGTSEGNGIVSVYDTTTVRLMAISDTGGDGVISSGFVPLTSTSGTYSFKYTVPISGWDSNVTFLAAIPTNVQNNATDWTSYTPTITGLGTPTTTDFRWKQVGDSIRISGYVVSGTVAASAFSVTLPNSLEVNSTAVSSTANTAYVGTLQRFNNGSGSGTERYAAFVDPAADATLIYAMKTFGSDTLFDKENGNAVSQTGDALFLDVEIPIDGWTSAGTFLSATPKNKTAYIKDVKATTTAGGTFTSGAWQTRDLNTTSGATSIISSLSSNQFTLTAGKYQIEWSAPALKANLHQTRLANTTDSSYEYGQNAKASSVTETMTSSSGYAEIEITSSKVYEIQHRGGSTLSTNGFGQANSFGGDEVYTQVKITKIP